MMRLYRKKEIGIVEETISKTIYHIDRNVLSLLFSSKKPRLSSELKMILSTIYKTDVRNLEGLLGISLVDWKLVNKTK